MDHKITISDVYNLKAITETFLCPLSANIYNIDFIAFKIRDIDSKHTLFDIKKRKNFKIGQKIDETASRTVKYHFGPSFFDLKTIGTTVTFTIGKVPVPNF